MKKINSIKSLLLIAAMVGFAGCDKGFVEKNQNPYAITSIDPGILFTTAERNVSTGSWEVESTIVQQFVNAYDSGATIGFQFNQINGEPGRNATRWNQMYNNTVRFLDRALDLAKGDPTKANLYQMIRILRAMNYMILVDTYGDVPYSEANKAYSSLVITTPKYDKDSDIYADLYKELKEARLALDPTGAAVNTDIFFGTSLTGTVASVQIPKWQRLAGSLMLRLGMRYSKLDAAKATAIVTDALSGPGVMASNADNAYIPFNTTDTNPLNAGPRGTNPFNYYLYEPFVTQLRNTKDPRGKYIAAYYQNPNTISGTPQDTVLANQVGFPVGVSDKTIGPGHTAQAGTGYRYSQLNYASFGSTTAPIFVCTYAQTQLLLADAAIRGFVAGGLAQATTYYNTGIRSSMDEYALYPTAAAVPDLNYQSYIRQPAVALTAGTALDKINTQYWIESLGNNAEAYANFRRTGFPSIVTPNTLSLPLLPASTGGFARRIPYPSTELSVNAANYQAAVARMGGDNVTQRVFWDIP